MHYSQQSDPIFVKVLESRLSSQLSERLSQFGINQQNASFLIFISYRYWLKPTQLRTNLLNSSQNLIIKQNQYCINVFCDIHLIIKEILFKLIKFCTAKQNNTNKQLMNTQLKRKNKQESELTKKLVHNFSNFAQMIFQTKKLIQGNQNLHNTQIKQTYFQSSKPKNRIKFVQNLWDNAIIVGNQRQLDVFSIIQVEDQLFADYYWSLYPQFLFISGVIISKRTKINQLTPKILVYSNKILQIFQFQSNSIQQCPKKTFQLMFESDIQSCKLINKNLICVFQIQKFMIYQISQIKNKKQIVEVFKENYKIEKCFQIAQICDFCENNTKIFFYDSRQNEKNTFGLYYIQFEYYPDRIESFGLRKAHDFKKQLKSTFKIINYSKQIILINLGLQIIAIKNCLIIDNINVNYRQENCFFQCLNKNRIIHFQKDRVQSYYFEMNKKVFPQKIIVEPQDSIVFSQPLNSNFVKILQIQNGMLILFQEASKDNKNKKQVHSIKYWFSMTNKTTIKSKLDNVFPTNHHIQNFSEEDILMFQNISMKMGLKKEQAYLELWRRSKEFTQKSYQILIKTKSFQTIIQQILNKMKTSSIKFRQLYKIVKITIQMLQKNIYQQITTTKNFQQYSAAIFFYKKLQCFRDIQIDIKNKKQKKNSIIKTFQKPMGLFLNSMIPKSQIEFNQIPIHQNKQLLISIKDFKQFRDLNLKIFFLEELHEFMYNPNIGNSISMIRILIQKFKIYYILIYKQVFEEILKSYQANIIIIVKAFPQLLPLQNQDIIPQLEHINIWSHLKNEDFQNVILANSLQTIQNKQILQEFLNSLWFKRNIYSLHGIITETKKQIQLKHKDLFQNTFYSFYSYFLQLKQTLQLQLLQIIQKKNSRPYSKNNLIMIQESLQNNQNFSGDGIGYNSKMNELKLKIEKIKQLFLYVESKYELIPNQIKGYSQIYYKLCTDKSFKNQKFVSIGINQLIKLKKEQLFKIYFQNEKQEKGFLLKYLRVTYEKSMEKGKLKFIQDMKYFFNSKASDISDLKIILNRFNSQHLQFFYQYESLYEVIIETVKNKIVIGTINDISINQIVIYLQDIAFSKNNKKLIMSLRFIHKIHKQQQILRKSKLNMTIRQIQQQPIKVISRVMQFQVLNHHLDLIIDYQQYKICAYKIISQVNLVKVSLYGQQHNKFPFFAYLVETMKIQKLLPFAIQFLINQKYLIDFFKIDYQFKLSLFYYLFKWRTSTNPLDFLSHQQYITDIMSFMPQISEQVKFIHLQLSYAQIFNLCGLKVPYPICLGKIPTLNQIQAHIHKINILNLQKVHIKNLFGIMQQMRQMFQPQVQQDLQIKKIWFLKQLHEMFLCKFISQSKLKQAIKIIYQMLKFPRSKQCIIYPILIIDQMMEEVIESSQNLLLQLVSYYFDQPEELTKIIQQLFNSKKSTQQFQESIKIKIQQQKQKKVKIFTLKNSYCLFKKQFLNLLTKKNSNFSSKFQIILQNCLIHVCFSKEDFRKQKSYNLLYRIMCHSPYLLAKFLFCRVKQFNLKNIRAFFSYLIQEVAFQPLNVLIFAKRLFQIILYRMMNNISLDQLINKFSEISLLNLNELDKNFENFTFETEEMLFKTLQLMKKKIQYFKQNNLQQKIKNSYKKINIKQEKRKIQERNHKKKMKISQLRRKSIEINNFQNKSLDLKLSDQEILIRQSAKVYNYSLDDLESFKNILQTPQIILQFLPSRYIFTDGDDSYQKQQNQEFRWEVKVKWPTQIHFNQINERIQIFCNKKNTRFQKINSITRKKSQFYQQSIRFKSNTNPKYQMCSPLLNILSNGQNCFGEAVFKKNSSEMFQQEQTSPTRIRGTRAKLQKIKQIKLKSKNSLNQFGMTQSVVYDPQIGIFNQKRQKDNMSNEQKQKIKKAIQIELKQQNCNEEYISRLVNDYKNRENLSEIQFLKFVKDILEYFYNNSQFSLKKRFYFMQKLSNEYLKDYMYQIKLQILKKAILLQLSNKWFYRQFPIFFPFAQFFKNFSTKQNIQFQVENQKSKLFFVVLKGFKKIINPLNVDVIEKIISHSFGQQERQMLVSSLIQILVVKQLQSKSFEDFLLTESMQLQIIKQLCKKVQEIKTDNKEVVEFIKSLRRQQNQNEQN